MKRNKPHTRTTGAVQYSQHTQGGYCVSSGIPKTELLSQTQQWEKQAALVTKNQTLQTSIWQPLWKGYGTNQSNAMYLKYPNVNVIIYFQRSRRKLTVKSIKPSPTTEQNTHAIPEPARERSILKTPFTTLINYSNTQTNFFLWYFFSLLLSFFLITA